MKIVNPYELVGKEVLDANGNPVGYIDKTWNSWNQEYPGWFFGIKPNENTRNTYFRGTYKLIPVYSDYIRETKEQIILNKTMDQLSRIWNKTIYYGSSTYPTEQLVDKPLYDKNYSKIGIITTWVESDSTVTNYGCIVDPYLSQAWNIPNNTLMPIPIQYIYQISDIVTLDKTLNELRNYWKQQQY